MLGLRAVTGFTRDVRVFPGSPFRGLIVVADDAGILPGVSRRVRPHGIQRSGAVVTEFSKLRRNDRGADHQEQPQTGKQHDSGANQVT